jgi:hypothetical protein
MQQKGTTKRTEHIAAEMNAAPVCNSKTRSTRRPKTNQARSKPSPHTHGILVAPAGKL